jgi:hypothetical protein
MERDFSFGGHRAIPAMAVTASTEAAPASTQRSFDRATTGARIT